MIPITDVFDSISRSFSGIEVGLPAMETSPSKSEVAKITDIIPQTLVDWALVRSNHKDSASQPAPVPISEPFQRPETVSGKKTIHPEGYDNKMVSPIKRLAIRPEATLLNTSFLASEITLGSLVSDVSHPLSSSLPFPYGIDPSHIAISDNFDVTLSYDTSRLASYWLAYALSFGFINKRVARQSLTAPHRRMYALKQHADFFEKLRLSTHPGNWVRELSKQGRKIYLVVSYLTLFNAEWRSETLKMSAIGTVMGPIALFLPFFRADFSTEDQLRSREEGEHVYAVGYRRVKFHRNERHELVSAQLADKVEWKVFLPGFGRPGKTLVKEPF